MSNFLKKLMPVKLPPSACFNVKDYGLERYNIYDDYPAVKRLPDRAGAMGRAIIFIPDGTYQITDPGNGDSSMSKYGLRISSNTTNQLAEKAVLHKMETMN